MKKIITLSIFFVLFLSSCSVDWNWEKDNFEKKKECANLEEKILLDAKKYYWWIYNVKDIIYSPILSTCLYKVEISYENSLIKDYDIRDYFEKKLIITSSDEKVIESKIKELKWE